MLLDAKEWAMRETEVPEAKGEYILYYTIRSSDSLWKFCRELAEKKGLKILRIGGNILTKKRNSRKNVEYICDASPEEWLYLVHNARYVVTNSFHGTAFSIIYKKDFFVEFSSATNTRLEHITQVLGLESCVIREGKTSGSDIVDYSRADEVLPAMKEASRQFLQQTLADAVLSNESK